MKNLSKLLSNGIGLSRSVAMAVFMAVVSLVSAQTVSISPKTGNVISAASYSDESHLAGFGGAWVHGQLPMTLVSSDKSGLTGNGLMKEHANNVGVSDGSLVFASGKSAEVINHLSLSLPKGYRFTSYKIVMDYDDDGEQASTFKEMDAAFSKVNKSVAVSRGTTGAVLQRTSMSDADMGNILYFRQDHPTGMARVKVTSFVVTFECTDQFSEALRPASLSSAVSCVALPFQTQRVDFGQIKKSTAASSGYTSYKYNYNNVKDLAANFLFYDEAGIVGGTAVPGTEGDKAIQAVGRKDGRAYMGLKNNTYWLESPTEALSQDGKTKLPLGYRIVGARVLFSNGVSASVKKGDVVYITDGNGRYMNASLRFTTTKVAWAYGTDGKVSMTEENKITYLMYKRGWSGASLSTTTTSYNATIFKTNGSNLYCENRGNAYIVSYDDNGDGCFNNGGQHAVLESASSMTGNASFTVKLFDKTGNAVAQEAKADADNPTGELVLGQMNNDAIKLQVEGLKGDNLAYVSLEVELEALNPYIDKMDIACTLPSGETKLKQQYLADDFTIGINGKVDFAVPANVDTKNLKFDLEGLHHKKADETYADWGKQGQNSRYHFVKSAYYDLIGENLQGHRTDAADYDYAKKIRVDVAGNTAFRCNNSDKFKAGTSGSETFYYEEYRYSNAEYAAQGGTWGDITTTENAYRDFYMMVCDETRYNIAPTTTPRHAYYAYYSTSMKLERENYEPVVTYTRVYDNAMLADGFDSNFYAGVKVTLRDKSGNAMPEGTGYVYAKQVIDKMNETANGKPADLNHVLYVDLSKVKAVITSENDATIGKLADIKALVGKNAMLYLPQGVTASLDNVASRSEAGDDFNAENDIVLTDKLPFFSLYDIRVNADNEVIYSRTITKANNTAKWVSVVMPFTLALDPETGTYRQPADGGQFTFYTMNADNSFSSSGERYTVNAHFSPCLGVPETEANKPYLVNIENHAASSADDIMFTLRQSGATIVKTPSSLNGETAQGTVDDEAMSLANRGTYSGEKIAKAKGVFYFNKDLFVSSLNLDAKYTDVYVLPFRTWYDRVGTASNAVRYIRVSTEPNTQPTGISWPSAAASDNGFELSTNGGVLTVKASNDVRVCVRALSGATVRVATLRAGDTRTFSLPSGLYVVNGTKVVVR